MKKNIKILFKQDGESGQECALAVNNKPVTFDNMFDNYLGECDTTLEGYISWSIEDKIKEHIALIADGYYYNSTEIMDKVFNQANLLNLDDYRLIDEKDIDAVEMVEDFAKNKKDFFIKYKNLVIKKLDFNLEVDEFARCEFLYCNRLEKNKGYYAICDKELESSVSFCNLEELSDILKESPEYFTDDEILVSAYYLVINNDLIDATELILSIESQVVGKGGYEGTQDLHQFIEGDIFEFIRIIPFEDRIKMVAKGIKKLLEDNSNVTF